MHTERNWRRKQLEATPQCRHKQTDCQGLSSGLALSHITTFMDAAFTWEGDKMDSRPFERIKGLPIASKDPGTHCWHMTALLSTNPFPAPHEEQPQQGHGAAFTYQTISHT